MSTAYYPFPHAGIADEGFLHRLKASGLSLPEPPPPGRYPTPRELRRLLGRAAQGTLSAWADPSRQELCFSVVGAEVTVRDYAGPHADDTPHEFYFPKGDGETILALVRGLAHFCGPFLVLNDLVECTLVAADTEPGSWLPLANLDA